MLNRMEADSKKEQSNSSAYHLGDQQPGVTQVEAREVAHILQVPTTARISPLLPAERWAVPQGAPPSPMALTEKGRWWGSQWECAARMGRGSHAAERVRVTPAPDPPCRWIQQMCHGSICRAHGRNRSTAA